MKKLTRPNVLIAFLLLSFSFAFSPPEHGVYVQLHPGNNKKIVVQIVPDKTYSDVVAYINFYSADNKRVAQQLFSLSNEKDRYIPKGKCTTKTFKFSLDKPVTRVTIDHVNEKQILAKEGNSQGSKLNLPVSASPLGPIEK
jgi:hypothetical protein